MYLDSYQEIIGILHDIHTHPMGIEIIIITQKKVVLPVDADKINRFLGKRIRIFNNNGTYIIKEWVP